MAKKRRPSRSKSKSKPKSSAGGDSVSLRQLPGGGAWTFVHPRCARDRAEDIEEVQLMIEAGEIEVATDELRWLLSGCSDFMAAHLLLGEIAINHHNDVELARGHVGYAYQLGLRAWRRANQPAPVPFNQPANHTFHQAGSMLAWCLEKLGKPQMAGEVVDILVRLDPSDPLQVVAMIDNLRNTDTLPLL